MELKNLFLFTCTVFILNSCTPHTSYNMKKGSSSIIIYDDNYISIQRSTEVLSDELFVSHLINKKADFKDEDFTILDISDSIANTKALDLAQVVLRIFYAVIHKTNCRCLTCSHATPDE